MPVSQSLYDGQGLRRLLIETDKETGAPSALAYVGDQLTIQDGQQRTHHVMLNGTRVVSRAVGPEFSDKQIHWAHSDPRGSVDFETDHEGKVLDHVAYFPSGELWYAGASAIRGPPELRFQGKEFERKTGFYAFGKRHYEPRYGVWLSADPALPEYFTSSLAGGMGNPRNLGLYSYAWNNPLRFIDPDGRFASDRWSWAPNPDRTPEDAYRELRELSENSVVAPWAFDLIRLCVASLDTDGGNEEMKHAAKSLAINVGSELLLGAGGEAASGLSRAVGKSVGKLGRLRSLGNGKWISSAGLRYGHDKVFGNRVKHVLNHGKDRMEKALHGVFDADRRDILGVVDEAWLRAQQGGAGVSVVSQGSRTSYTVDMGRRVGYVE